MKSCKECKHCTIISDNLQICTNPKVTKGTELIKCRVERCKTSFFGGCGQTGKHYEEGTPRIVKLD